MSEVREAVDSKVGRGRDSRVITDEAIAELRAEIGRKHRLEQYNTVASADNIRRYALGAGDDNPRYLDPAYAKSTRWGAITAPSTFIMSCGFPRVRGLPGVHGLFTGIEVRCHRPIVEGTRIHATTAPYEVIERQGSFAGRQLQQVYETEYVDDDGQLLSTLYSHAFRTDRKEGGKSEKYKGIERKSYDPAELAEIERAYDEEVRRRRGATPLFFEDVEVGEPIGELVKGPLTVTDMICFKMGFGYIYVKAHRQLYEYRKKHPGAAVKDKFGVWDIPERVHWEETLARDIGMPSAYDYGPQRIAWLDHAVSDWMGDDGFIRRLFVKLVLPNFVGDTTWVRGKVVGKDDERSTVRLDLEGVDQRGRVTVVGEADVELPRR